VQKTRLSTYLMVLDLEIDVHEVVNYVFKYETMNRIFLTVQKNWTGLY